MFFIIITLYLNIYLHIFASYNKFGLLISDRVSNATRFDDVGAELGRILLRMDESVERTSKYRAMVITNVDFKVARRSWYKCGQVLFGVAHVNALSEWIYICMKL